MDSFLILRDGAVLALDATASEADGRAIAPRWEETLFRCMRVSDSLSEITPKKSPFLAWLPLFPRILSTSRRTDDFSKGTNFSMI